MSDQIKTERLRLNLTLREALVIFVCLPIIFGFVFEVDAQSLFLYDRWMDRVDMHRHAMAGMYVAVVVPRIFGWCFLSVFFALWGFVESRNARLTAIAVGTCIPFVEYFLLYNQKLQRFLLWPWTIHWIPFTAMTICAAGYFLGRLVRKCFWATNATAFLNYLAYGSWTVIIVCGVMGIQTIRSLLAFVAQN